MSWFKQFLPSTIPFIGDNHNNGIINNDIPTWLKELVKTDFDMNDDGKIDEETRSDFFAIRMFIFTPKGDVVDLPIESSPIDFAYAIHSDIGNHVSGAKVNGKFVSLDTKLKNGDIVEIISKASAKPSSKWLEITKTNLAKRHIRSILEPVKEVIPPKPRVRKARANNLKKGNNKPKFKTTR
jgi:(p)ppGpp synthase/HD superfamily hydrolase